jgi:hypothetical protein
MAGNIEDSSELFKSINRQNNILSDKINKIKYNEIHDKQDVNIEKALYVKDSIYYLRIFNNYLFGFYIVLLFILAYLFYKKDLPLIGKILVLVLLLLYPFFISGLQDNLRFIYNFLFSETTNINVSTDEKNITELSI